MGLRSHNDIELLPFSVRVSRLRRVALVYHSAVVVYPRLRELNDEVRCPTNPLSLPDPDNPQPGYLTINGQFADGQMNPCVMRPLHHQPEIGLPLLSELRIHVDQLRRVPIWPDHHPPGHIVVGNEHPDLVGYLFWLNQDQWWWERLRHFFLFRHL